MKKSIVAVFIIAFFVSANLNHNYPFQKITYRPTVLKLKTNSTSSEVTWLINDTVTAQAIPIAFKDAEGLNTTITTSWGNTTNVTLESPDRAGSMYVWISFPTSTEGTGNISVALDNDLQSNHTVYWRRFIQPATSPLSLSFTFRRFSHWNGESMLSAHIYPNGSAFIDYTLSSGQGPMEIEWFPYDHNFTFNVLFNLSIWSTFSEYLITNKAINWQSWEYLPNAPYGDLGGWQKSLIIDWNDSYQSVCHAMVDDDSGVNRRILTPREVGEFFALLMTILDDLIEEEMNKKDPTALGPTNGSIFIFSLIIFLTIVVYRRKRLKY